MHNRSVRGHHDRVFLRFFFFAGISFSLSLSEILCGVRVNGGLMPAIVNHDTVWLFFLCAATVVVMGSPQSSHTRCTHKDLKPFFFKASYRCWSSFFFLLLLLLLLVLHLHPLLLFLVLILQSVPTPLMASLFPGFSCCSLFLKKKTCLFPKTRVRSNWFRRRTRIESH